MRRSRLAAQVVPVGRRSDVGIVLALCSALSYGTSDFIAGLASRRYAAEPITFSAQMLGVLTAAAAIIIFPGHGPTGAALAWGALSGVGSALGVLSLYRGLAVAPMTIVATLSAVLTAVIPVLVGVVLGNHLGLTAAVGIIIAIPAIGLTSWHPDGQDARISMTGPLYGGLAGLGFALLFIALDQAGTHSGAWPLLPGQVVSVLLIAPLAYRSLRGKRWPSRTAMAQTLIAGILSGLANLLFLGATAGGQLAIVAVLTSLYPACTVLLARLVLSERWTRLQAVGLLTACAAITLVSAR